MHVPAIFRRIRHAPVLRRADPVWNKLHPLYRSFLRAVYGGRGVPVTVGVHEQIRVAADFEGNPWIPEEHLWNAVMSELRPGDRFADVGAHIGAYTIAAARRGALVTAFEPNPLTAAILRQNLELNAVADRVTVNESAISAAGGTVHLELDDFRSSVSECGVEVQAAPLAGTFDVVKIDVEGHELEVLRGAAPLLRDPDRRPRTVFLEVHVELEAIDADAVVTLLPGYIGTRLAQRDGTEHWRFRAS
jgi:FkbM family methyltransferase